MEVVARDLEGGVYSLHRDGLGLVDLVYYSHLGGQEKLYTGAKAYAFKVASMRSRLGLDTLAPNATKDYLQSQGKAYV